MKPPAVVLAIVTLLAFPARPLHAEDATTLSGAWTLSIPEMSMRMSLTQNGKHVTGALQNPHSNPIALKGTFASGRLTLTGASHGGELDYRVSILGITKPDGSLAGIVMSNAGDFTWTATRAAAK